MLLKMRELRELPLTDLTAIRLDTQMDPSVLGQVGGVGKRLRTLGALVWLGFAHMHLCV